MKVLVTGANGFVGRHLCRELGRKGHEVSAVVRTRSLPHAEDALRETGAETVAIEDIGPDTDWSSALAGKKGVIHLAARVHQMSDPAHDPLAEYRRTNVEATRNLARAAAAAGLRRFVFASSVKVNGERTPPGRPFSEADPPAPSDPYGVSKWEAERELEAMARETGLETVVVRPPLVYGPGVGANFLRLLRWVDRGWPLPLGSANNRRSLVGVANLCDLLIRCLDHPGAVGELFLASDGEDLSTAELIRHLAGHLGRPCRLVPVPAGLLRAAAAGAGQGGAADRLLDSLTVDSSKAATRLGWSPPLSVNEGLAVTARWYLEGSLEGGRGGSRG